MHQHRRVRPEHVVEPMRQDGQGLQELSLDARIGPPWEEPKIHEPAHSHRVASKEAEHLRGRPQQLAKPRHFQQDRPVIVIIEHPSHAQGRKRQHNSQRSPQPPEDSAPGESAAPMLTIFPALRTVANRPGITRCLPPGQESTSIRHLSWYRGTTPASREDDGCRFSWYIQGQFGCFSCKAATCHQPRFIASRVGWPG